MKKIILGLVIMSSLSVNIKADDSDPVTIGIIYGVGATAGVLLGYAGIESYNILSQDNTATNTQDNTTTNTGN